MTFVAKKIILSSGFLTAMLYFRGKKKTNKKNKKPQSKHVRSLKKENVISYLYPVK